MQPNQSMQNELASRFTSRSAFIDPTAVVAGPFHGRHMHGLKDGDYRSLKQSIREAGGNVAPVLVCTRSGDVLELVFGRRRLQACLELGLPLFSVESGNMAQAQAFEMMLREASHNWSVYEIGTSVHLALERALFPSTRRLGEACGMTLSNVQCALELARLPRAVVDAFDSPTSIDAATSRRLRKALEVDPARMVRRASELKPAQGLSARRVADLLCSN